MLKLSSILFITITVSCNAVSNKQYSLPTDSIMNVVVKTVIEGDSNFKNKPIAIRLVPYTRVIPDTSIIIFSRIDSLINPMDARSIMKFLSWKMKMPIDSGDTAYYDLQFDASKDRFLNTEVFAKDYKFVKIDYLTKADYFRRDSLAVFFVPIFTVDKKYAYINCYNDSGGWGTILKNENDQWIIVSEFGTWWTG